MSELDSDELNSLLSRKRIRTLPSSKELIDRLKAKFRNLRDHPEIPESKVLSPGIDSIKMAVCAAYRTDEGDLLSRRRGTTNEARNVAVSLCRRLSKETLAGIGKELRLDNYGSVSSVVSRMKRTLTQDVWLRKRVERLERELGKAQNRT
jgi:chromosomal replication initiation ATPase DnaA